MRVFETTHTCRLQLGNGRMLWPLVLAGQVGGAGRMLECCNTHTLRFQEGSGTVPRALLPACLSREAGECCGLAHPCVLAGLGRKFLFNILLVRLSMFFCEVDLFIFITI